jgi:wyosine [tRNA(Phe)-imidazoG37] synthetase (radical SAM superfamily)
MLLALKKDIIYGPVNSRRLGRSLGLNILPGNKKACPFDCVYCQYGWTEHHTTRIEGSLRLPSVEEVKKALETALIDLKEPPAFITFSGNGEPTLHPDFDAVVKGVISVRDRLAPVAQTAILSNSALVWEKSIQESLGRLDVRIMKLDCGSPLFFERYNQPCAGVDLDRITQGLEELENVTIQALFTSGESGNLETQNIQEWIERLKRIRPRAVQLYTLDRDYPDQTLKHATKEELSQVREKVKKAGIPAEVYSRSE